MIHLYFLVYKLTGAHADSQFSTDGVIGVKNVNICFLEFSVMSVSDQSEFMSLFMVKL
jgi:hypothetical protein